MRGMRITEQDQYDRRVLVDSLGITAAIIIITIVSAVAIAFILNWIGA
jgi:hypothetical protein